MTRVVQQISAERDPIACPIRVDDPAAGAAADPAGPVDLRPAHEPGAPTAPRTSTDGVDDSQGRKKKGARDIVTRVPIDQVLVDPELYPRHRVDQARVKEFAARIAEDADAMPSIDVVPESDHFVLADGRHRLEAHLRLGRTEIAIRRHPVPDGRSVAQHVALLAVDAAATAAKPLKMAERRDAIIRLHRLYPAMFVTELADHAGYSRGGASRLLTRLGAKDSREKIPSRAPRDRGGSNALAEMVGPLVALLIQLNHVAEVDQDRLAVEVARRYCIEVTRPSVMAGWVVDGLRDARTLVKDATFDPSAALDLLGREPKCTPEGPDVDVAEQAVLVLARGQEVEPADALAHAYLHLSERLDAPLLPADDPRVAHFLSHQIPTRSAHFDRAERAAAVVVRLVDGGKLVLAEHPIAAVSDPEDGR